ncbi:MbcA/ParS/Xre antitoxin family protein [Dyadobacter sp. CY261]|uniref:MbcA/ParS/Xre antitoxin family protein n=1 Tax=Dyadobacter sp. CY261 TaxID=2907203 RepID=UPI001F2E5E6B|nr:MbcA/ParS/Xre antitoxin family protein [Dyadobacter sp. CY261]MCF0071183.1 MbcA/ParS/Xre antitoxin family protein [Dyadobacter sp. CY261]
MKALALQPGLALKSKFKDIDMDSNFAIVRSARKGLNTKVFYDFAGAIKMPEKRLAAIMNVSARTISNYKDAQKTLEPLYGEHLLKLIALFKKGEELLGSIDEFNYWLQKPFWNSAERPAEWLTTGGGVDFLSEELDKLAEGYPA